MPRRPNMSPKKTTAPTADKFSPRRAWLCALPFLLLGGVALILALYGLVTRQLDARAGKHLLTLLVVCGGLALVILGWFAGKRTKPAARLQASHPDEPWQWREDWVAGRVDNSVRRAVFFLWVFVIFFDLVSLAALWVAGHQVRYGNPAAWLGLCFPFMGLAVTAFAGHTTRTWRRFGRAVFAPAALPARPGAVLAGEIRIPARLRPQTAFYLRLGCVRRTTAPRGKQRITTERVLWQEERWLRPELPQPEAGVTRLPVFFVPPGHLPESTAGTGDGVQWRLEASAQVSGPDFQGCFEVPVYKPRPVADADATPADPTPAVTGSKPVPPSVPPPLPDDPTLAWQLTLAQIRQSLHSRIRVTDQADGREIVFPAGRAPGFAAGATVLWLIWTGVILLMLWRHAPPLFPLVFAALDALMTVFLADLWLRRSRVRVTPAQVTLQTAWLTHQKETVLAAAEVASLKADPGANAGHTAYYDLKLRTRDGREFIIAKYLSHKPEADWLIRQMAEALKRG
jgi:hypothetical protein